MSSVTSVEKPVHSSQWQGSLKLVRVRRAIALGWIAVAEARLRNMLHWGLSIAMVSLGNPILYLFSIGIGIGALVNANGGANQLGGVDYLTFVAPALLASAALVAFQDETSFPVLEGLIWNKNFFAMNSTLLSSSNIVGGVLAAAFVRALFTVVIYEGVLLLFGAITLSVVWPMFYTALFGGLAFGSGILAAASYVKQQDMFFAVVFRFIVAPMMLFSGTFYPLETMPVYLQWVGWLSPLWHATDLGRTLSYGHPQLLWVTITHWLYLGLWVAVGIPVATRKIAKRLAA